MNYAAKINVLRAFKIAAFALLMFWSHSNSRLGAQTVSISIDTSPAGRQQIIDGFGTCLSGTEASQTTWWTNLYYGDLQASMLRMDLTPNFKAPYSNNNYNSPSYGNAGPGGNYARTYTNATTYTNLFNGSQAQIAVMGPNINSNIDVLQLHRERQRPASGGCDSAAWQIAGHEPGRFQIVCLALVVRCPG